MTYLHDSLTTVQIKVFVTLIVKDEQPLPLTTFILNNEYTSNDSM